MEMTKEEARDYIIRHCNPDYPKGKTEWETALNMAIDALSADGDCISRQAAKLKVARVIWEYGESCNDFHDKCVDCLDDLPSAQPEQRWIPCNWQTKEENLPKECKSVLICMKDSCGYQIGVSYRTDYNRWEGYGRVNVIAWMPLPEPYVERREE